jgi:hypothetical protein
VNDDATAQRRNGATAQRRNEWTCERLDHPLPGPLDWWAHATVYPFVFAFAYPACISLSAVSSDSLPDGARCLRWRSPATDDQVIRVAPFLPTPPLHTRRAVSRTSPNLHSSSCQTSRRILADHPRPVPSISELPILPRRHRYLSQHPRTPLSLLQPIGSLPGNWTTPLPVRRELVGTFLELVEKVLWPASGVGLRH